MREKYLLELGGENIDLGKYEALELFKFKKYSPKLEKDNGTVFEDDFTKDEFDRTIEKNNLDHTKSILYPIKNSE